MNDKKYAAHVNAMRNVYFISGSVAPFFYMGILIAHIRKRCPN